MLKVHFSYCLLWINHDIHRSREQGQILCDCRPHSTFNTITGRCSSQGPTYCDSDLRLLAGAVTSKLLLLPSRLLVSPNKVESRQDRRKVPPTGSVDKLKF
jgi:hypothetical protein